MGSFTHLHVHTEYSLLDGAAPIKKLIDKAAELNMDALAITDHGVMYGAIDFYKAAKEKGIKPIIGCEVYVAPRSRFDKQHGLDTDIHHLILLAKNRTGYENLIKIVSAASVEGFYYKPRADRQILEKYSEGIVCMSACLAGEIASLLLSGDYDGAKKCALWYRDTFGGENYFLEIQDHGLEEQKIINPMIIKLSAETGIPLVATNDLHYIEKSDAPYQDVLMCIQTGKTVYDEDRMKFSCDEFYLKSPEEMRALFDHIPEAIENTNRIADMCNVEFDFSKTYLPRFDVPDGYTAYEYLKTLCKKGLDELYYGNEKAAQRLEYELSVIEKMGYVDYFLIVWDFIRFAKKSSIPVGPGRGSGAGSIVARCLNITTIDPLRYNLLFERFLNPERVSMPDIDTDFCIKRRGEVIDYVIKKYGADRVSQIITFGRLMARAAIRDTGRALDIPLSVVDKVAKLIPNDLKMTIDKALHISKELKNLYDTDESIRRLIDTAKAIEGLPRHSGVHAAGVVITDKSVDSYVPLQLSKDAVTTQYHMDNLGELGLLKMDFLGLRNLTVIKNAIDNIQKSRGELINSEKIDYNRKEVFDMIGAGDTMGVFQLESGGMQSFMKDLRPSSLEDIIAGISLYRPGPMDQIPKYVESKHNPEKITYMHPMLESILDVTYGCIVYQEQVLQIVQKLAGYSLGKADLLRRAMSKKKPEVMKKEREFFIHGQTDDAGNVIVDGAVRRGVPEKVAEEIFDEIMVFAGYAFNKSHAAAYAVVAYQTAYLKRFYCPEYMAALLSDTPKVAEYIADCEAHSVHLLPPDINKSFGDFSVEGRNIRFGMNAIRNVGEKIVYQITEEREKNGDFKSFSSFLERVSNTDINKRAIESFIACGMFDSLGYSRRALMESYEKIASSVFSSQKENIAGQCSLFDDDSQSAAENILPVPEYDRRTLLSMEKTTVGLYLSGHPLEDYKKNIKLLSSVSVSEINSLASPGEGGEWVINKDAPLSDGDFVTVGGIITSRRNKTTKSNTQMAFLTLEDLSADIEVIVFPKTFEKYSAYMAEDSIVFIKGRVSLREDEAPKIMCEQIIPYDDMMSGSSSVQKSENTLYIKIETGKERLWNEVKKVLVSNRGDDCTVVYFEQTKSAKTVSRDLFCNSDAAAGELSSLLGEDCVKIKKNN